MTEIKEGDLTFSFPDQCRASKYDEWSFYRNQFQPVAGGSKAVDILCLDKETAWLIEVKDYRQHPRTKLSDLDDEVAEKVRDTLAGLAAASANANDAEEQELARRALRTHEWRVALHLEQPAVRSPLRPQPFNPANVALKLRSRKLKPLTPIRFSRISMLHILRYPGALFSIRDNSVDLAHWANCNPLLSHKL